MHAWCLSLKHACLLKLVLWVCASFFGKVFKFKDVSDRSFLSSVFSFSLREVMVPSLHWLLLLWGLQGLWAQDYEEDYEEEVVTTKKKSRLNPSNSIPQNGKCKSKVLFFKFDLFFFEYLSFPLMLFLKKVVWNLCRQHIFHCFHHWKKAAATGKKNRTWYSTRTSLEDAIHSDWSYLSGSSEPSISCVTIQCSVTQMFYSFRILFPQAHSLCDIFPWRLMWFILSLY